MEGYFAAGVWSPRLYREAEQKVKDLPLSEPIRYTFAILFRELREVRQMRLETLRRMRALSRSETYRKPVELLQSVPGIGQLTAIRLVLELGDVRRFGRKEEFAPFLGLVPSDYSSGEQDHKGHITKQGNRHVRWWLIESAWIAIRHDPVLLEKYKNVISHTGSAKKAIVAVARKLAMKLRAVLLSGEPYQVGLIECQSA
jgi:transposase